MRPVAPINFFRCENSHRIQKIPIDMGTTCPNRDGTLSTRGCLFCSPRSFLPFYCSAEKPVLQQLEEGIAFYSKRYQCHGFLAYFQSNCATYGETERFLLALSQVLAHSAIEGAVVATRPDCLDRKMIDILVSLSKIRKIRLEIGIESLNSEVLEKINRCHSSEVAMDAVKRASAAGLEVCGHIILGLPGENRGSMINGARKLAGLSSIKLHHLQIVKGSELAAKFTADNSCLCSLNLEEYVELVAKFLANLSEKVRVERLVNRVPRSMLLAPVWNGVSESDVRALVVDYMTRHDLRQGCQFSDSMLIKF